MPVIPYQSHLPDVSKALFIAPDAWITGKVLLAEQVSILFGAVLRGDIQRIIVGAGSNIQDNAVLHTSRGLNDLIIGTNVTVGHSAILHGCTIQDNCIIGMGCTILDDAIIPENCIVGANALVTMRSTFTPGTLIIGSPARVARQLKPNELKEIQDAAASYRKVGQEYKSYFASTSK